MATYHIAVHVQRLWSTTVTARSYEEAEAKAMAEFQDAPREEEEFYDATVDIVTNLTTGKERINI